MTQADSVDYQMSIGDLHALARERFGPDPADWAFVCPHCGDIATPRDFMAAGSKGEHAGRICIGRVVGALAVPAADWDGRGCDWTAFGVFRGPMVYLTDSGEEKHGFKLAPAPTPPVGGRPVATNPTTEAPR